MPVHWCMVCSEGIVSQPGPWQGSSCVSPRFLLAPVLGKQALVSSEVGCFAVFGNKVCPVPPWRRGSSRAHSWKRGALGAGGRGAAELPGPCLRSSPGVSPAPPAPHAAQLRTRAGLCLKLLRPAQLYLPALKRAEKRVRGRVWDGMWGRVESLRCDCSVCPFISRDPGKAQLPEQCK